MRVLVIGASRGVGRACVEQALAAGHGVRALARSAGAIPIDHERLEKMTGDALSAEDLARALAGVDGVVQALGASPSLAPVTLFSTATRLLVDAMRTAGVRRLVAVTGLGAGDSRGHGGFLYDWIVMPLVLKRIYDDKDVQERIIRDSGLEWTIVRPGYLTNNPAGGSIRVLLEPGQWRAGTIARADVARFIVGEIEARAFVGKAPVLLGA